MTGSPTILLVEDNPNDSLLIRTSLQRASITHSLQIVEDGEDAIRYLAGDGTYSDRDKYPLPRLVLLDLGLPKKSGLEVLQWIAMLPMPADFAVVVISGSSRQADVAQAYDLGARSFLVKPTNPDDLVELVAPLAGYLRSPDGRVSLLTPSLAQQMSDQSRTSSNL